jgi:penicillin amidase
MKPRRRLKFALRLTVLLLVGAAVLFAWWRCGGQPQRSGQARLPALGAAVEVRFDERAVPHVRAASLADAARAMGWLHANDRIGQMELMRRYVLGTLAEIAGESALSSDRSVRELRFPQTVDALFGSLAPESRAILDAYAEGVNAWLEERGGDAPPDLRLMRARPAPWSARHSLCVQMMMSQMLSYSAPRELSRLGWVNAYGARRASLLIGDALANVPRDVLEEAARAYAERALGGTSESKSESPPKAASSSNGSNNWAVAGERAASGHALVANDPHLGIGLPSIWFQAQIRCPEYEASGFTIPGMPLVVIGQGPRLAWGFTNSELDVCDAFIERLSDDGRSVERDGEWTSLRVAKERIDVRGGATVEFEALSTEIGPLLTWGKGLRYSLAWTGHAAFDPVRAFVELARATSVDAVPALVRDFVGPPQNLVCGDASGAILFTLLGRNVERGAGDGRVPLLASQRGRHWRGLRPYEHAPSSKKPREGALATANNDLRPPTASYPFPQDAAMPHRAQRIFERLDEHGGWTAHELGELQTDTVSLYSREVVQALAELASVDGPAPSAEARQALDALAKWDGDLALRGTSALYHLVEARIDEWLAGVLGRNLSHPERDRVRLEALYGRLDEPFLAAAGATTGGLAVRREQMLAALGEAWREGAARFGDKVESWDYGALHVWTPEHRLGALPLLGPLFNAAPAPVPGNGTSPCVFSGGRRRAGDGLPRTEVGHGASLRFVANCAVPDESLAIVPGGQSGHPFDEHYADQLETYLVGELRPMHWSESAIEAATRSVLTLAP